jgi:hypothetical protein
MPAFLQARTQAFRKSLTGSRARWKISAASPGDAAQVLGNVLLSDFVVDLECVQQLRDGTPLVVTTDKRGRGVEFMGMHFLEPAPEVLLSCLPICGLG